MTSYGIAFLNLPGGNELLWIFLIVLLLFGASALPKLFRSLGRSVREFKKAQDGLYDEMDKASRQGETSSREGESSSRKGKSGAAKDQTGADDADTANRKPDAKPDE